MENLGVFFMLVVLLGIGCFGIGYKLCRIRYWEKVFSKYDFDYYCISIICIC